MVKLSPEQAEKAADAILIQQKQETERVQLFQPKGYLFGLYLGLLFAVVLKDDWRNFTDIPWVAFGIAMILSGALIGGFIDFVCRRRRIGKMKQ
jgi:hypothetical protein